MVCGISCKLWAAPVQMILSWRKMSQHAGDGWERDLIPSTTAMELRPETDGDSIVYRLISIDVAVFATTLLVAPPVRRCQRQLAIR